jgi:TfoX/Sxy family transcriptional regulator of competence genes
MICLTDNINRRNILMAYDEKLADKIRLALAHVKKVEEKKMFGGIAFMVNGKMCLGVDKEDIMLRCTPEANSDLLIRKGVRPFDLTGKPMKGWLLIGPEATKAKKDFDFWVTVAIESNKQIVPAKSKKR